MSEGYKERCLITDEAVSMWSFDGDVFDRITYQPSNLFIIDEVDNNNPAYVQHESPTIPAMTIGNPSLIGLEMGNQYSAIFGGVGQINSIPQVWPKTYLNIASSPTYAFPDNGSFSVEFVFRKDTEDPWVSWRSGIIFTYPEKISPIIRKSGVFTIYTHWGSGGEYLTVQGPLASHDVSKTLIDYQHNTVHCVLVWDVKQITPFQYIGTQSTYLNNILVHTTNQTYFSNTFPVTNNSSPIEIGGFTTLVGSSFQSDRNASRLYLDQVSIYNYGLDQDMVAYHYKKIYDYVNMITHEFPKFYWSMSDNEIANTNTAVAEVGGKDGTLYGGFVRSQSGPPTIPITSATRFTETGFMHVLTQHASLNYYRLANINSDYTFELWFRSSAINICTLASMRSFNADFSGLLLELNVFNDQENRGAIQFTERLGVKCSADGAYNDDAWHHVLVRRAGNTVSLFVDGVLKSTTVNSVSVNSDPGQLMVFSDGPHSFAGPGAVCHIAFYSYALSDAQVSNRVAYQVSYRISGKVTLQGNPVLATLRFYHSNTGELISEIDTDSVTGDYTVELLTNENVDILVFDKYNKNVRYRAYGPVAPSANTDLPISI